MVNFSICLWETSFCRESQICTQTTSIVRARQTIEDDNANLFQVRNKLNMHRFGGVKLFLMFVVCTKCQHWYTKCSPKPSMAATVAVVMTSERSTLETIYLYMMLFTSFIQRYLSNKHLDFCSNKLWNFRIQPNLLESCEYVCVQVHAWTQIQCMRTQSIITEFWRRYDAQCKIWYERVNRIIHWARIMSTFDTFLVRSTFYTIEWKALACVQEDIFVILSFTTNHLIGKM